MDWIKQSHRKSLLGQLLVDKKIISEQQLAEAIDYQKKTGQRLGEIFTQWNILTNQQIESMLRKQRNVRLAAAITTALLAPLQVFATTAAAPVVPITQTTTQTTSSASQRQSGLRPLTEEELSSVSGQGLLNDNLSEWLKLNSEFSYKAPNQNLSNNSLNLMSKSTSGLQVLGDLATLLNPLLMFLDAKTTVKDVVYDPLHAAAVVNKDGSITLSMPSSIGEIRFDNIRVEGSTTGPSFGSIDIKNINLSGTTVTLRPH